MQTDEEGAANEVSDGQQTRMVDGELHWWMVKLLLHVLHELRAQPGHPQKWSWGNKEAPKFVCFFVT